MRLRVGLTLVLAGAVVASPSLARGAERARPLDPSAPGHIYVGTSKGRFLLDLSGRATKLSRRPWHQHAERTLPRGWIDVGRHEYAHVRDGHVVVTRGRETVWSSEETFHLADRFRLWDAEAWGQGFTYQVRRNGPLYASLAGCPEQRVGRGMFPEGITRRGVLVVHPAGTGLFKLWRYEGRARTLAHGLSLRAIDNAWFERRSGTFLYWTSRGKLVRTDGVTRHVLVDYHALGFHAQPDISLLPHGLIALLSRHWREVVLAPDGDVFARASAPADGSVAAFGDQAASHDGTRVAYVEFKVPGPGATVYVLRQGFSQGRAVYRSASAKGLCAPSVSWRGRWLLFSPAGGDVVAIDSAAGRSVDLTQALGRLPGSLRKVRWVD